jgi:tRNA-specific 2-thiouridylase
VNTESKAESQDLCFVPDDGHGRYVEEKRPELKRIGRIVDGEGNTLGEHTGIHHFTIGQRKGLGVAAAERLYVKELHPAENEVVLAARPEVQSAHCFAEQFHWLAAPPVEKRFRCTARVRYRHEAAEVEVICHSDTRVELIFAEPQFAITPGQAAVLYRGDEVLGGGWISTRREAA